MYLFWYHIRMKPKLQLWGVGVHFQAFETDKNIEEMYHIPQAASITDLHANEEAEGK